MKFIKRVNDNFYIYKLSDNEQKHFNGRYALSSSLKFSDFGEIKLLNELPEDRDEEFFQTESEAYYQAELMEMKSEINRLKYRKDISSLLI